MGSSSKIDTFNTCAILFIMIFIIVYIMYKFLDYQARPMAFREGMTSGGNVSISDFKDKVTKQKEAIEGTIDIAKNKSDLEDIIGDLYDITNYRIIGLLYSAKSASDEGTIMRISTNMQFAQGLQKLTSWLDSKSSSSSGGMFG